MGDGRGVRIWGKTYSLTLKLHHGDNVPAIGGENKERKQLTKYELDVKIGAGADVI